MKNNKKYIILTLFIATVFINLFIINYSGNAQNIVKLPEINTSRGEIVNIPIICTIKNSNLSQISLVLSYDYYMLNIKNVIGKSNYGIKSNPTFNFDYSLGDYKINISSTDVQAITNDTLCQLVVEILAGSKNVAQIIPDTLYLNNNIDSASLTTGIVNISDPLIIKSYPEGIGLNYPNPVSNAPYTSTFPFNIEKASTVEFTIFDFSGCKTISKDDYKEAIKIYYFQDDGSKIEKKVTDILDPGTYNLFIEFKQNYFASGIFTLIMTTSKGVYYRNFMIVR